MTSRTTTAPAPAVEATQAPASKAQAPSIDKKKTEAVVESFKALGLEPKLLTALEKAGFKTPTPIQGSSIPAGMKGEDIIGIAQTGTGKTLAFGLPILNRFIKNGNRSRGRALMILPTRELALQVNESLAKLGRQFGLRTAILIGGAPMRPQLSELRNNPDIIVATPGRLIDHLQSRALDLRTVDVLVLDEADRMLDMGFAPQIKQILREVPSERQTLLFSATMPDTIVQIANNYMKKPVRIEVARAGSAATDVTQELFVVPQEEKNDLLGRLLFDYTGTVLVFTRTRSRASRITRYIRGGDHTVAEIHADRSLSQRRAALDGFKSGRFRVLVATDIAARGIDVSNIECVINYDLPDCPEDYVHRIGRTGRAGKSGHAVSFAAPDQSTLLRDIEKVIKSPVKRSEHSLYEFVAGAPNNKRRGGSGGGRGGNGRGPSTSRGSNSQHNGAGRPSRFGAPKAGSRGGASGGRRFGAPKTDSRSGASGRRTQSAR